MKNTQKKKKITVDSIIKSKLSTMAALGAEESGRCGEVAVMGR